MASPITRTLAQVRPEMRTCSIHDDDVLVSGAVGNQPSTKEFFGKRLVAYVL